MIAFASMLVSAAEKAGMKVPSKPDDFVKEKDNCPHFYVFCVVQLGAAVSYHGCHWDNAKIIANIPDDQILSVTFNDLISLGYHFKQ